MTIINNSPLRDISEQNELITNVIDLYLIRQNYEQQRRNHCCLVTDTITFEMLFEQLQSRKDPAIVNELCEETKQAIIDRNRGNTNINQN